VLARLAPCYQLSWLALEPESCCDIYSHGSPTSLICWHWILTSKVDAPVSHRYKYLFSTCRLTRTRYRHSVTRRASIPTQRSTTYLTAQRHGQSKGLLVTHPPSSPWRSETPSSLRRQRRCLRCAEKISAHTTERIAHPFGALSSTPINTFASTRIDLVIPSTERSPLRRRAGPEESGRH
jgi:hypothetical protein